MKKSIYTTPAIEQIELLLEQCIAASTTQQGHYDVTGVDPQDWQKGNENWF